MSAKDQNENIEDILIEYPDSQWMYFVSKPRLEKNLLDALTTMNIPCYLPRIKKTTYYNHGPYVRYLPMFPRYVFASTRHMGYKLEQLNSALLKVNHLPEYMSRQLLDDLKVVRKFEVLSLTQKVEVSPEIVPGKKVLVTKGYFTGSYAIVKRRKNFCKVMVNLLGLNMSLAVEIPLDYLELVSE